MRCYVILPAGRRSRLGFDSCRCAPGPLWFSGTQGYQSGWCLCSSASSDDTSACHQTQSGISPLRRRRKGLKYCRNGIYCMGIYHLSYIKHVVCIQTYGEDDIESNRVLWRAGVCNVHVIWTYRRKKKYYYNTDTHDIRSSAVWHACTFRKYLHLQWSQSWFLGRSCETQQHLRKSLSL